MMRLRWVLLLAAVLLVASAIAGVAQPRLGHVGGHAGACEDDHRHRPRHGDDRARPRLVRLHRRNARPDRDGRDRAERRLQPQLSPQPSRTPASPRPTSRRARSRSRRRRTQDGTTIIGYAASTTISAKTTIAKAGAVVDAAVEAGANGVSGPSLSRSDEDALYRDALKNAVADAKDKAEALAAAAGLTPRRRAVDRRRRRPDADPVRRRQGGRSLGRDRAGHADDRRPTSPSRTRRELAPLDRQPALRPLAPRAGVEPPLAAVERTRGAARRTR